MKKLFLHIGPLKTGSTTLQSFLYQNRDNLRNSGYLYPQTGRPPKKSPFQHSAQHNLSWTIINSKKANPDFGTWEKAHDEIKNTNLDNVIVSSEFFEFANKKQIDILKTKLKFYEVKILVYVRRQDLRLESLYTQNVKHGVCATDLLSFIDNRKEQSDYYKLLEPWKQAFGISNIIVRPLEKTQIPNIYHDILKVIGITDYEHFSEVDSKNIKPGRKALEVLKLANKIYQDRPKQQQEIYVKKINNHLNKLQETWSDRDKYCLLSYSESCKILDYYKQSNQAVAQEYLGREDGVLFYERLENYENDSFTIEDLSKEELLSLMLISQYGDMKTLS